MDPLWITGYVVVAALWGAGVAATHLVAARRKHQHLTDMDMWFALAWGLSVGAAWPLSMPLLLTLTVVAAVKGSDRGSL
jgi:hypothetical protein